MKEQQRNTVLQDDDSVALIRQLQEEDTKQEQSTAEGERLSEEIAKQLDMENQTVATRLKSRRNRETGQQSRTTRETSATDKWSTKRRQKKKVTRR